MIETFAQISIILVLATFVAVMSKILRQPLIISYILTGILVSPYFLDLVPEGEAIDTFILIGVSLLLFMVGLHLNPKIIKDVGKASVITGLGQVFFTSSIGFLICTLLGFSPLESAYIAVALTFSSTIIIMKLLSDKGDLETLYGKISVGFLIVQDIVVVFVLLFISSLTKDVELVPFLVQTVGAIAILLIVVFSFSYYLLPRFIRMIARSQELLLLFSLAWCFSLASLFHIFNFSMEMGALIAGVTLAMSPFRYEISSKMKPLRDFFLVIFFISLGSEIVFSNILQNTTTIIILSLFILIGNPIIVLSLMGVMRFRKRTGFLAGLTVAQISEFSLILVSLGVTVGHLDNEILSIVTVVGLITISGSSYLIIYANRIYPKISKLLSIFEKSGRKVDEQKYHEDKGYDTVLFGCERIGRTLLESFTSKKRKLLIVDYNPDVVNDLASQGYHVRYGDVGDVELLNELEFTKTKMVISTVNDLEINKMLLDIVKSANPKMTFIATSTRLDDALEMYDAGAAYVIIPHFLGAKHASMLIKDISGTKGDFKKIRRQHLKYLRARKKKNNHH
ncbi:MAG: cation:proton antiporter [Candidatus Woesearchaeota archaeon]